MTRKLKPEQVALGAECRQARLDLGLNQRELAERLGVSQPGVSNWESGASKPPPSMLPMLRSTIAIGASRAELRKLLHKVDALHDEIAAVLERLEKL